MESGIKERRSIRKFTDREVTKETILEIADLARYAPSWKNSQVVRYHVVKDKALKDQLAEHCVLGFAYNAKTMQRCNTLVVVTVVKNVSGFEKDGSPSTPLGAHWESFDAGIASQTFCLGAHAKGVGSVILGIFDEQKMKEYMPGIPEDQSVAALIALGYSEEEGPKAAPSRREVAELVSFA